MSTDKTLSIIYDGDCGFCLRSLKVLSALDVRGVLCFHKAQDPGTFERFPILNGADVQEAMYSIVEGETPQRGFFSFRRFLWESPLLWPLLPFFYFPGVSFAGTRAYAFVARNRRSFGCETDSCPLPTTHARAHAQYKE